MALGKRFATAWSAADLARLFGAVHRKAAALDGEIELVAGCFSSSPEKSQAQGRELLLDPSRVYNSYQEMAEKESKLPPGERIDFVAIVTPNNTHFEIAKTFIEAGFHVVCDKPMTTTIEEAEELVRLVQKHDVVFALTHNYTGYPMVKQARELVRSGHLGEIRKIVVEYPQGWLAKLVEGESKQASWRTDPKQAGVSSCIGDIGSHAENLADYITGLEMAEICADLTTFVSARARRRRQHLGPATKTAPAGSSMRRRFLSVRKTTCASGSTALRRLSSGTRSIRPTCGCATTTSPRASTAWAIPTIPTSPSTSPGFRPVTPRPLSRLSPTSTAAQPAPWRPRSLARSRIRSIPTSRR